ncbi:hypothetical protein G6F38_010110 [Rhizopus arrhizus]|nr:hypothetical protein G6F38_010110 [Rhizopus arrhizus]
MPSTALSTAEDKNKVRRALPTAKIYAATVARLYVAYPNPHKWAYSNIWGAVTFLKDKKNRSYYIRIIDLINHKGVIWEQELYDGFEFVKQTPFFYSFALDEYMAGLSFADVQDADQFYTKITTREAHSSHKKNKETSGKKPKGKLDKSQIGLPSEFRHLGHIGYTPEKGFSVQNSGPEWNGLFDQLKDLGFTAEDINENEDFIKDFVTQRGGLPPPPPPRPSSQNNSPSIKSRTVPAPPASRRPPPPPVGGRRPPPPPPPSRRPAPPPPPSRPAFPTRTIVPRSSIPVPPPPIPRKAQEERPTPPLPPPPPIRREVHRDSSVHSVPEQPIPPRPPVTMKSNNPYKMMSETYVTTPTETPSFPFPSYHQEEERRYEESQYSTADDDTFYDAPEEVPAEQPRAPPPLHPTPTRQIPAAPNKRVPPPPPVQRSSVSSSDDEPMRFDMPLAPMASSSIPAPPPPPPVFGSSLSPATNDMSSTFDPSVPPPPPPPPPPPVTHSAVSSSSVPPPPPPPPPPATPSVVSALPPSVSSSPVPPPPPAPSMPSTPASAGEPRNALLESIRSAGGIQSLRSTPSETKRDRSVPLTTSSSSTTAADPGADLATSLIAALNDRKKAIQSDDDSDSDDGSEWDD